jgi:hypothetical protein
MIEVFYKKCSQCRGLGWTSEDLICSCPACRGLGLEPEEYRRFCGYAARKDCEWGGDCRHCEDAEPILQY